MTLTNMKTLECDHEGKDPCSRCCPCAECATIRKEDAETEADPFDVVKVEVRKSSNPRYPWDVAAIYRNGKESVEGYRDESYARRMGTRIRKANGISR